MRNQAKHGGRLSFLFGCAVAACASSKHPAQLGDYYGVDADPGESQEVRDATTCIDDAAKPPSPGAFGLCGQYFLDAAGEPPNLYFVLDRSGSMAEYVDGLQKYSAVAGALVNLVRSLGSRVNVGAAVFPSRLVDRDHPCLAGEEVFAPERGDPLRTGPCDPDGPITRLFSGSIALPPGTPPQGSTPTSATLAKLLPKLTALGGRTAVVLATDGGPNCNSSATCDEAKCIPNIENECKPGINCCDPSIFGPESCLDEEFTIESVKALYDHGIKTYVVGIPGSSPYSALLNQLALAGGTARLGTTAYYDVEHIQELDDILATIGSKVTLSCHLRLADPPPDAMLVNVYLDSALLKYGADDGWKWSEDGDGGFDDDNRDLDIIGPACDQLENGNVQRVEITFGCKTEIVR